MIIAPAISSVQTALQPLIDWRRQQGWHVVAADLNDTGPTNYAIKTWLEQQYATLDPPLEHVVLVGDDPASEVYVASKARVSLAITTHWPFECWRTARKARP